MLNDCHHKFYEWAVTLRGDVPSASSSPLRAGLVGDGQGEAMPKRPSLSALETGKVGHYPFDGVF